jgi:glutaredoxin-related protein
MKILFYSNKCGICNKLLLFLDKNNMITCFDMVNIDTLDIDKLNDELKEKHDFKIELVPTILDTNFNQPIKGTTDIEKYLNANKYFNNPTNNIEYIKYLPPKPEIEEDKKAIKSGQGNLELSLENINENNFNEFFKENESSKIFDNTKSQPITEKKVSDNKKLSVLLRMRGR